MQCYILVFFDDNFYFFTSSSRPWSLILGFTNLVCIIYLFMFFCFYLSQVALKTLIVIHRTLREGDPTFREELLNFQQRGRVLQMSNFKDDSSPIGKWLLFLYIWFLDILKFLSPPPTVQTLILLRKEKVE